MQMELLAAGSLPRGQAPVNREALPAMVADSAQSSGAGHMRTCGEEGAGYTRPHCAGLPCETMLAAVALTTYLWLLYRFHDLPISLSVLSVPATLLVRFLEGGWTERKLSGALCAVRHECAALMGDARRLVHFCASGHWLAEDVPVDQDEGRPLGGLLGAVQAACTLSNYLQSFGPFSGTGMLVFQFAHAMYVLFTEAGALDSMRVVAQIILTAVVFCTLANLSSHRYFSHHAFRTSRVFQAVLALAAALSGQRGALWWASHHKAHHRHCGAAGDPHDPTQFGFAYSHYGWLLDRRLFRPRLDEVRTLWQRAPELLLIEMLAHPCFFGFLQFVAWSDADGMGGSLIMLGFTLSLQFQGLINSYCHTSRGSAACGSRDSVLVALLNGGEGFHLGHHLEPTYANHGWRHGPVVRHLDLVYLVICACEGLGLVWDVRRPAPKEERATDTAVGLPKYLVTLDTFKATAMIIILALQASTVSGLDAHQNGALMGFEMMSGLFFEISAVGTARSACRALQESQTKRTVRGRLLWRALLVVIVSLPLHALTSLTVDLVKQIWFDSEERSTPLLLAPVLTMRALTFHGVCQMIAVPVLLSMLRSPGQGPDGHAKRRAASGRAVLALMACAAIVLAVTPRLRPLADAATCCIPDHAALGHRGKCDQDVEGGLKTKPTKPGASYPLVRVPAACELVRISETGTVRHHTFDPCDFLAAGPPYLPPCTPGRGGLSLRQTWPLCERARDLSTRDADGGGAAVSGLCDVHDFARRDHSSQRAQREARAATARCRNILLSLWDRVYNDSESVPAGTYARLLGEEAHSASFGLHWCPLISHAPSDASRTPDADAATKLERAWDREVIATVMSSRPYWRGAIFPIEEEQMSHLLLSPRRLLVTWALNLLFGLHGAFAYLAPSFVGMAIGVALEADDGVSRRFLALGTLGCVGAFGTGLLLIGRASAENLQGQRLFRRAAAHSRLLFGAVDSSIILALLGGVERFPRRRAAWEASTVLYRRFARHSFTIYATHEVISWLLWRPLLSLLLSLQRMLGDGWFHLALTAKGALACHQDDSVCTNSHAAAIMCLMVLCLAAYGTLLALWSDRVGSLEARILRRRIVQMNPGTAALEQLGGEWPAVFAQITMLTWWPALFWMSVSIWSAPARVDSDADPDDMQSDSATASGVPSASIDRVEGTLVAWLVLLTLVLPLALSYVRLGRWSIGTMAQASSLTVDKAKEQERLERMQRQLQKTPPPPAPPTHNMRALLDALPRQTVVCATLVVYIAARSVNAASGVWWPVPGLGYFRAECGALGVALVAAAATRLPARLNVALALLVLLSPYVGSPPRYYVRRPYAAVRNETVQVYDHVLSARQCAEIAAETWDQRQLWVKVSATGALPYFSFGWIANFDKNHEADAAPLWSWRYGLRPLLGSESYHALSSSRYTKRMMVQAAVLRRLNALIEPVRGAIAAHLQVNRAQVVFGGESNNASMLGHPGIQVYLPNILWHTLTNPHEDDSPEQIYTLGEQADCDAATLTTFVLPIVTPTGAGILHWNASGEHETLYKRGSMYAFRASLTHSIRPWPYIEWRAASEARMTLQAFALRCGTEWRVFH